MVRLVALALLFGFAGTARARQPSEDERRLQAIAIDSRAAGRRDALDGKEFAPEHVSASEHEELAWRAGYERGWTEGRLEVRLRSGRRFRDAGMILSSLGTIGMIMLAAIIPNQTDDYGINGYVAVIAPIASLELAIGLPMFVAGIVRMARAGSERRLLDDPELQVRRIPSVAPIVLSHGGGLALSGSF